MISERSIKSHTFDLDDSKLVEQFVQGSNQLLASANLRLEVNGGVSQLMTRTGDAIAIMYLQNKPRSVIIKHSSPFVELIDQMLIDRDFVMFGDASRAGFTEYRHYVTPAGYRVWYTDPAILWKKWWPTERFQDKQRFNMDILVSFKNNWYPVQNIHVNAGTFTIKTIAGQFALKRNDKVLWLAQIMQEQTSITTVDVQPQPIVTAAASPAAPEVSDSLPETLCDQIYARSIPADLAQKIQQKQSEINPDRAWPMIKDLEQKLQAQIKLNTETQAKFHELEQRATIAEQRLQVVYQQLQLIGINPHQIYKARSGN
jgi:hypothetical protein